MAVTVANVTDFVNANKRCIYAKVTLDSQYNTAGEAITPGLFGLITIDDIFTTNASGYATQYVRTNDQAGLLKVYAAYNATTSAGVPVESAASTDFSAVVVSCLVVGN